MRSRDGVNHDVTDDAGPQDQAVGGAAELEITQLVAFGHVRARLIAGAIMHEETSAMPIGTNATSPICSTFPPPAPPANWP